MSDRTDGKRRESPRRNGADKGNGRLTMADIAGLAGVSVSTVSRALRNSPSIPAATRERIAAIALEHRYTLDQQAQNFRLGKSGSIALVFPYTGQSRRPLSDPFYMEAIGAVSDALEGDGGGHSGGNAHPAPYDLLVSRVSSSDDRWVRRYVEQKRVDGVILVDRALQDRGIRALGELGAPFAIIGVGFPGEGEVAVGSDGVAGARLALEHLMRLGRRRIGFIGGAGDMAETYTRAQGYRRALAEAGLPIDERWMTYTDFSAGAGQGAMHLLLDRAPDLDAVFACSDLVAMAAMGVLRARGRRVPDDVAVIGFDDIQLAAHTSPPLTTIRQDLHTIGQRVVENLLAQLNGGTAQRHVLLPELVVRESCGGG